MSIFKKLGVTGVTGESTESQAAPAPAPAAPADAPERPLTPKAMLTGLNFNSAPAQVGADDADLPTLESDEPGEQIGADFDTTGLEAQTEATSKEERSVKALDEAAILEGPAGVRQLCDEVDRLMTDPAIGLSHLSMPTIREYCRRLMITLKNHPEYDSVILDKDVRNMMAFIQATRVNAVHTRQQKVAKLADRQSGTNTGGKKKVRVPLADIDFDIGFDPNFFANRNKK